MTPVADLPMPLPLPLLASCPSLRGSLGRVCTGLFANADVPIPGPEHLSGPGMGIHAATSRGMETTEWQTHIILENPTWVSTPLALLLGVLPPQGRSYFAAEARSCLKLGIQLLICSCWRKMMRIRLLLSWTGRIVYPWFYATLILLHHLWHVVSL